MFTGLIEAVCTVTSVRRDSSSIQLTIDLAQLADGTNPGDSIAINGTCLTVTELAGNLATFDVSDETLKLSTLSECKPSQQVNAELPLKATDRFGGHFVQGHIDGTATIKEIDKTTFKPRITNQIRYYFLIVFKYLFFLFSFSNQ